ncbi:MAG: DUF1467 family protein [Boseongicola sp.]|nr:DUF1467 family protein [Boseongicola sp.]MDD9978715.1 DUF1467 family protein [Boseongicola sp.]
MSPVSALVLLAVIWFMVLFLILPMRLETQGDVGEKVEGTPAGAPSSSFSMRKRMKVTTYISIPIWIAISAIILWGGISVEDLDMFNRMGSEAAE